MKKKKKGWPESSFKHAKFYSFFIGFNANVLRGLCRIEIMP